MLLGCVQGTLNSGGLKSYQGPLVRGTSDLLNAKTGGFSVTEENRAALPIDPLAAHMQARKQVRPTDRSSKRAYTATADVPHGTARVRLLRLEGSYAGLQNDQQFVRVPSSKPRRKKEKSKIAELFMDVPKPLIKPQPEGDELEVNVDTIIKPALKPKLEQPNPVTGGQGILNVRTGVYESYMRIVMDMDAKYAYEYKLGDNDKSLTLILPEASWSTQNERTYAGDAYLKSYSVKNTKNDGSSVVFKFNEPIDIKMVALYTPEANKPYRIVIDVRKTSK